MKYTSPEQSPGFLLWQVSTEWRRNIEEELKKLALTHPQFVLLANVGWLTRKGADISQIELARHCRTDINMTSQVLRTLEKKGLIERYQVEGNEKAKYSRTTSKGTKMIAQAIPLVEAVDRKFFAKFPNLKTALIKD